MSFISIQRSSFAADRSAYTPSGITTCLYEVDVVLVAFVPDCVIPEISEMVISISSSGISRDGASVVSDSYSEAVVSVSTASFSVITYSDSSASSDGETANPEEPEPNSPKTVVADRSSVKNFVFLFLKIINSSLFGQQRDISAFCLYV